jgi:N-acetyl-gamma-glutamylphosphate reductase
MRFVLGIDARWNRIMVFNVLDSIGKGGALAGIENMNIMFCFNRSTGLAWRGMHPN